MPRDTCTAPATLPLFSTSGASRTSTTRVLPLAIISLACAGVTRGTAALAASIICLTLVAMWSSVCLQDFLWGAMTFGRRPRIRQPDRGQQPGLPAIISEFRRAGGSDEMPLWVGPRPRSASGRLVHVCVRPRRGSRHRAARQPAEEMSAVLGSDEEVGCLAVGGHGHAFERFRAEPLLERLPERRYAEHAVRARARHRHADLRAALRHEHADQRITRRRIGEFHVARLLRFRKLHLG